MTHAAFAARLAALASETPEFVDGARVLDPSEALTTILDEIDSTVLAARLTFRTDTDHLTVLVTGRRLHKITSGAPDGVLDRPLDPDDRALTVAAAQVLEAFATNATTLRVAHGPVAAQDANMSDRVSVGQLNAALGRVVDDPNAPPVERFVNRMNDSFLATIRLTNRVSKDMTGNNADLAQLKIVLSTQLSGFLKTRAEACASHSDPSLTLFADVLEQGTTLGLADFGEDAILFSVPTGQIGLAQHSFYRAN